MELNHVLTLRTLSMPRGPGCRRCARPIDRSDSFGVSERVCGPCRGEARGRPTRRLRRKR
jgi:hypothetical protein